MLKKIFFGSLLIISGCIKSPEESAKKQATGIALEYVKDQLDNPVIDISENGIIIIGNDQKKYIIDPAFIFTGLVDDDDQPDAIVTVVSYDERKLDLIEHLIIIRINKRMIMQRSIESDMKILTLKDRIITAEVPTHSRNSPLFYCPECREVIKFRYVSGELVKVE
jgi:hypothetical protein